MEPDSVGYGHTRKLSAGGGGISGSCCMHMHDDMQRYLDTGSTLPTSLYRGIRWLVVHMGRWDSICGTTYIGDCIWIFAFVRG